MVLVNIAILRTDHSSQYQSGARSVRYSLRPQTTSDHVVCWFVWRNCYILVLLITNELLILLK